MQIINRKVALLYTTNEHYFDQIMETAVGQQIIIQI